VTSRSQDLVRLEGLGSQVFLSRDEVLLPRRSRLETRGTRGKGRQQTPSNWPTASRRARRPSGSISVAFYTSSARAAGGGAPTGGLGSQRCIVPRHV